MSNRRKLRTPPGGGDVPPLIVSPHTGDAGIPGHPWIRLNDAALRLPAPAVMCDIEELHLLGHDPRSFGMVRYGDHDGSFEIPLMPVSVDMKSRYDVDIYEAEPADPNHPGPHHRRRLRGPAPGRVVEPSAQRASAGAAGR